MTSPTISSDAIPYLGGYSIPTQEPYAGSTQRLKDAYSPEYLQTLYDNMVNTFRISVCRRIEYQDALDKEVHSCMTGQKKPKERLTMHRVHSSASPDALARTS